MDYGSDMTITLLTDFGDADIFVGVMKGVIRSIAPQAVLVDLTHAVPPQDVATAAFYLRMAYAWFPEGTVHLVVVDPGVGTSRRAIAATCEGHFFVAPDNGVLGELLHGRDFRCVSLDEARYRLASTSATFHGRDLFAPAAAWLATGLPLERLGAPVTDPRPGVTVPATRGTEAIEGRVAWIDHFGNVVSNIPESWLPPDGERLTIRIGPLRLHGLHRTYAEAQEGEAVALINSFGFLEVAVNRGRAADLCSAALGTPVAVLLK